MYQLMYQEDQRCLTIFPPMPPYQPTNYTWGADTLLLALNIARMHPALHAYLVALMSAISAPWGRAPASIQTALPCPMPLVCVWRQASTPWPMPKPASIPSIAVLERAVAEIQVLSRPITPQLFPNCSVALIPALYQQHRPGTG